MSLPASDLPNLGKPCLPPSCLPSTAHLPRLSAVHRKAQIIDLDAWLLRSFCRVRNEGLGQLLPTQHCPHSLDGALTVDTELDAVFLGPGALALAQEDVLIMGGDVCQGQSGPSVLEAEPVLVLPRFALALTLVYLEDECLLLLVDLCGQRRQWSWVIREALPCLPLPPLLWGPSTHRKPVQVADVALGMWEATLEQDSVAHLYLHQLWLWLFCLSRHTWGQGGTPQKWVSSSCLLPPPFSSHLFRICFSYHSESLRGSPHTLLTHIHSLPAQGSPSPSSRDLGMVNSQRRLSEGHLRLWAKEEGPFPPRPFLTK